VSYTYAEAVADGVCRPVAFVTFDGTLSWRSGEDVVESSFETVLSPREAARRYRTAISAELPEGLARIVREADARLHSLRSAGHRDAGGLAVAADAAHARQLAKLLREVTGRAPVVVLHTDADAARKLADFRASRERWIVAVNMVSEGVDIPRLRVGVYASAAKTALIFRQIVGRFVRTSPQLRAEPSWLYLPAEQTLRTHASEIESELRHALRSTEPPPDWEERAERPESERTPGAEFVPLNAEFAAQMTLFGTPQRAASPLPHDPASLDIGSAGSTSVRPALAPVEVPAFERHADLRRERSRLVAELHRRDGRSHREINSWFNRAVGLERVDEATIAQLERSIETLVRELTRGSRRAAAR
jgi:hypothetical protein